MPKKKDKKKGDKTNERKKMTTKESSERPANKSGFDDREKDLYLTQIGHLTEELERFHLKCDRLEQQKEDLTRQCSALREYQSDAVAGLKRSLKERDDEVDELSEQLERQKTSADQDREVLQLQQVQTERRLQQQILQLAEENSSLTARLAGLEDFQRQKEDLLSNVEFLEKRLSTVEHEHQDQVHRLEMKTLLERQRLEAEMEEHLVVMAAEVENLVDQKLPETTRAALRDIAEVKTRYRRLTEQAQLLTEENSALKERQRQLSLDVDLLEDTLRQTSRLCCVHKKKRDELTEKCQHLQAEKEEHLEHLEKLQREHTDVLAEVEDLRRERTSLSEQNIRNRCEMKQLEVELQEEMMKRRRMKNILQEAALMLESELDSGLQWKQLMQNLLVVLKRCADVTSCSENDGLNRPNGLQANAAARLEELELRKQFLVSHPRTGDPGPVPRVSQKQKDSETRTGSGTSSCVPLLRKPVNLKTRSSGNRTLTSKPPGSKLN